jgi:hypothetical protein
MSSQLTTSTKQLVVWGTNIGVAYTTGSIGTDDNLPQSSSFTKDGDEAEIRDAEGEVQTFVCYNKRETLDIEVVPVGTARCKCWRKQCMPSERRTCHNLGFKRHNKPHRACKHVLDLHKRESSSQ